MLRRARAGAVALALVLGASAAAHANGRFPSSQYVLVGPGPESRTIVLRTTFGFAVSDDSGASFHWICEEALNYDGPPFDPPVALDAQDRLHVALFNGLMRVSGDRCGYQRLAELEGVYLNDLDMTRDGRTVVAVSSTGGTGVRNRVYRSEDSGGTYSPLGAGVENVLFDTLEMAPSQPARVYVTGIQQSPREVVLFRSDDGGATLAPLPFAQAAGVTGAYIAAVDPTNPDRVYLRCPLEQAPADGGAVTAATALLRSDDGGQSFREVARTRGAMMGFAISDDGATLWMGGPDAADGLQRSDDRGEHWTQLSTTQVLCLRQHAGALYVCANYVRSGFALGRSMDNGVTVNPLLRFQDLQPPYDCPAPADASYSVETAVCGARWPTTIAQFVPDGGTAPRSDAGSLTDARTDRDGALSGGGCACTARGTTSATHGAPTRSWWWTALLAVTARLGRRRRRSHPQG